MISPGNKTVNRQDLARQSAEARRFADSLSVLKTVLQTERSQPRPSDRTGLSNALALIAALEDLHGDLARGAEDLGVVATADDMAGLCARTAAALLEPLGVGCEILVQDELMPAADFALLRQVLPIILAGAGRHAFPTGVAPSVKVRIGETSEGWCCAVMLLGVAQGHQAQGVAAGLQTARTLLEAAGGRLHHVADTEGAAVLIRLGLAPADPFGTPVRFH